MKLTYRKLHEILTDLTETELHDMMSEELRTFNRPTILMRLHQRFTTVRAMRERKELLSNGKVPVFTQ